MASVAQSPETGEMPGLSERSGSSMAGETGGELNVLTEPRSPATPTIVGSQPQRGDARIVVILYGEGQEEIVSVFADVLGKPSRMCNSFAAFSEKERGHVLGISAERATADIANRDRTMVVAIHAHCVDVKMPPDPYLSSECDYEFLYTKSPFVRRDLARFISFTLGQISCHETLMAKERTYFISTTFPDVRAALPNLDILTVGSDAVEIRVDLLKEPLGDGRFAPIPSLSYVGHQVMLLRQRTELPIIFTTRCTKENGRFPMDDPNLYLEYLYRAIQWGVEYIDVELWLPESIRKSLWESRGNSRIMSAFHDFSGAFRWPSTHATDVFLESRKYADIVKMITIINDHNQNFELEYFRYRIRGEFPGSPPLSAVNMGETGKFSRTLNRVFTPITHPLLPIVAAPGQMSAAEINTALSLLGQLPKKRIYGISSTSTRGATPQAPFYAKCFNELGLPHSFAVVERQSASWECMDAWCNQRDFGGAYLNPPILYHDLMKQGTFFSSLNNGDGPLLSEAAKAIGMVDTIVVRCASTPTQWSMASPATPGADAGSPPQSTGDNLPAKSTLVFDNAVWKGILSTLTRDLSPSAYLGRVGVVLAPSSDEAASVLFALKALQLSKIYTVGFKTPRTLVDDWPVIEAFTSLESMQRARMLGDEGLPFVIVSAFGAEKSHLTSMLVRIFRPPGNKNQGTSVRRVFLDLADASATRKIDPCVTAEQNGFASYGAADVAAFTTVETLRLLVGQNVPYSFVRLTSGRGLY